MQIDKKWMSKISAEEGFVRDTFEKVYRLVNILHYINRNPMLKNCLALKGGTAINLTIFNLPRLSVDIDLDYSKEVDKDAMLIERQLITNDIEKYMLAEGYQKSLKSKSFLSLDSMIFTYQNAAGINDNIKIEINYSMLIHIYPLAQRKVQTGGIFEEFTVLSVDGIEIFGSKIKALFDREAPRDLYDVDNMIKYGLFSGTSERDNLRKCTAFYMAVGNKKMPDGIDLKIIDEITWYRIKTDLLPVKRRKDKFDLDETKQRVKNFLGEIMQLTEREKHFFDEFRNKKYHPEYLFEDAEIIKRLEKHPMALWKIQNDDEKHMQ